MVSVSAEAAKELAAETMAAKELAAAGVTTSAKEH